MCLQLIFCLHFHIYRISLILEARVLLPLTPRQHCPFHEQQLVFFFNTAHNDGTSNNLWHVD